VSLSSSSIISTSQ